MARANPQVVYLPAAHIRKAVKRFPTPFFLYEERRVRENCRRFCTAFARHFPGFMPLFAVKANTNPELLQIVFDEGFGADASSQPEAWVARELGAGGMYTGNYTPEEELRFARECQFLLNLDDASMLPMLRRIGVPEFLSFRVNPGVRARGPADSLVLAGPDAKYGVPPREAPAAYRRAKRMGVQRFGIHAMTASNVLDPRHFPALMRQLLDIVADVKRRAGVDIDTLNLGGGFGVPYRPDDSSLDIDRVAREVRAVVDRRCKRLGLREPMLMAEPGRYVLADAGWLVGTVLVVKRAHKTFAGLDAGMNDLPRPAIYGAYHHVTVLDARGRGRRKRQNVVGRLCENSDQFARDRLLEPLRVGDRVAIHNAGAHAYAMGHNYNNRPRSAEVLLTASGGLRRIRRAETLGDLFQTTDLARVAARAHPLRQARARRKQGR